MSLRNLAGKRVLVTGASSGIGRATALAFARVGAELLLCEVQEKSLSDVRDEILAIGAMCTAYGVDPTDQPAMEDFAQRVHEQGGALDVLVNNAARGFAGALVDSNEAWRRPLGPHVIGTVHGLRLFLPRMHDAGGPRRIVNVASMAGPAVAPHQSVYAASKSAVIGLSEALSMELRLMGSRVGVTVVRPLIIHHAIKRRVRDQGLDLRTLDAIRLARLHAQIEDTGANAKVIADAIVGAVRTGREMVLVGRTAAPLYHLRKMSEEVLRRLTPGAHPSRQRAR